MEYAKHNFRKTRRWTSIAHIDGQEIPQYLFFPVRINQPSRKWVRPFRVL